MLAPPELPTITTYEGLIHALRARVGQLGVSPAELDHRAGFASGHTEKLLKPLRRFLPSTFALLGALGLVLRVEEDPVAMARITRIAVKRQVKVPMRAVKIGRGAGTYVSLRYLKKLAARGGDMRAWKLSKKRLRESARAAAVYRWKTIRETARAGRHGDQPCKQAKSAPRNRVG